MEEALKAPKEIWMVEHVYKKLVSRSNYKKIRINIVKNYIRMYN